VRSSTWTKRVPSFRSPETAAVRWSQAEREYVAGERTAERQAHAGAFPAGGPPGPRTRDGPPSGVAAEPAAAMKPERNPRPRGSPTEPFSPGGSGNSVRPRQEPRLLLGQKHLGTEGVGPRNGPWCARSPWARRWPLEERRPATRPPRERAGRGRAAGWGRETVPRNAPALLGRWAYGATPAVRAPDPEHGGATACRFWRGAGARPPVIANQTECRPWFEIRPRAWRRHVGDASFVLPGRMDGVPAIPALRPRAPPPGTRQRASCCQNPGTRCAAAPWGVPTGRPRPRPIGPVEWRTSACRRLPVGPRRAGNNTRFRPANVTLRVPLHFSIVYVLRDLFLRVPPRDLRRRLNPWPGRGSRASYVSGGADPSGEHPAHDNPAPPGQPRRPAPLLGAPPDLVGHSGRDPSPSVPNLPPVPALTTSCGTAHAPTAMTSNLLVRWLVFRSSGGWCRRVAGSSVAGRGRGGSDLDKPRGT